MLSQIVAAGWLPLAIVVSLLYTACVAAVAYDCGHARSKRTAPQRRSALW